MSAQLRMSMIVVDGVELPNAGRMHRAAWRARCRCCPWRSEPREITGLNTAWSDSPDVRAAAERDGAEHEPHILLVWLSGQLAAVEDQLAAADERRAHWVAMVPEARDDAVRMTHSVLAAGLSRSELAATSAVTRRQVDRWATSPPRGLFGWTPDLSDWEDAARVWVDADTEWREAAAECAHCRRQRVEVLGRRRAAILAAVDGPCPGQATMWITDIAALAGVSRQSIYKLLDRE